MQLPNEKQETLNSLVADLSQIETIAAVVLGGSYCIGLATENSDLDIGLYYHETALFDIDQIRGIAAKYNVDESFTVTGFYEWGAWVNGGAWINTVSGEVDFLYRNIEQVNATIDKAKSGIWENDYEQQPPFGFSSVIYLAETYYCHPLYDPHAIIQHLKNELKTYPPNLRQTIIQQALWAAEFTLWQAEKFARKADLYNAAGCVTRALKKIVDALFALNETYPMGDKRAVQLLEQLPKCPDRLGSQVEEILSFQKSTLPVNVARLRQLFEQVVRLAEGRYKLYFVL